MPVRPLGQNGADAVLLERDIVGMGDEIVARAQVEAFLESLYAEGAFVGRTGEEGYFVVCDERINNEEIRRAGKINLEDSRRLLRMYEEGLSGYTYLER